MDRLTAASLWPNGDAVQARRFLRYLDYWRRHSYAVKLLDLEQTYEPFSPDSDLLKTRAFSAEERAIMQQRLVAQMAYLLEQGNFTRVDPANVHFILTKDSAYGLDLEVDLEAFEEVLIYYRGATTITEHRRDVRKAYMRWKAVQIPVFQRMFLLFKLKPFDVRVREVMRDRKIDKKEAERAVRQLRGLLPVTVTSDYVYIKLFKNMPRSDVEMIFPNTKVRFRLLDKLKFGVSAGSGLGMGVFGTVSKLALLTNPYTLAATVAGLGGIALRQASNFMNQRTRYMVVLAQNLYFHAMADNRGVMTLLADRAAEEDIKEEMLLYSVLAKERVNIRDLRPGRRGDRAVSRQYLRHRRGLRRGGRARAPEAGRHRHRAARRHARDPAAPRGRAAHRQALGRLPRQPARQLVEEGREIEDRRRRPSLTAKRWSIRTPPTSRHVPDLRSPRGAPERRGARREAAPADGEGRLDAVLVPRADEHQGEYVPRCAERLAWLTGFTGSAGLAVVGRNGAPVRRRALCGAGAGAGRHAHLRGAADPAGQARRMARQACESRRRRGLRSQAAHGRDDRGPGQDARMPRASS